MKGGFGYPSEQGVPTQLTYARQQEEKAHVRRWGGCTLTCLAMFPEACPMDMDSRGPLPEHPAPGDGRHRQERGCRRGRRWSRGEAVLKPRAALPLLAAASFKAEPEDEAQFADADVYKGFKKMRKKLGKRSSPAR